jgi:hypothetical protein
LCAPFSQNEVKSFHPIAYLSALLSLGLVVDAEKFSLERFLGTLGSFDLSGKKRSVQFLVSKNQEF